MKSAQDEINRRRSGFLNGRKMALHTTRSKPLKAYEVRWICREGSACDSGNEWHTTLRKAKHHAIRIARLGGVQELSIREMAETVIQCHIVNPAKGEGE